MGLRKGKTKHLLESGIDCALIAVELYNKPRAPFRVETYITNMIMAWTKVFHAHFNNTIGPKYFYKKRGSNRYEIIDGERKAWELKTCIRKYNKLSNAVKANLEFFIKLRNKIEHRHIDKDSIGTIIFGECQSLLNNFEDFVVKCFGEQYAINESLAFALQFSQLRTAKQQKASKTLLSREVTQLKDFVKKYRESLDDETFNSQEYSIKLVSVPKISNANRNDLAVEFVNWNSISNEDKAKYSRLLAIIKERHVVREVINSGRLKAGEVVARVFAESQIQNFNHYDHKCLYAMFSVRPYGVEKDQNPFNTDTQYCHYDEAHDDYLYKDEWPSFIIDQINLGNLNKQIWKNNFSTGTKVEIDGFGQTDATEN